jgi:hypothetical protein
MAKVYSPTERLGASVRGPAVCLAVALALVVLSCGWTWAQPPAQTKPAPPAEKKAGTPKAKAEPTKAEEAQGKADDDDQADAKAEKKAGDQAPAEVPPDPSQTLKNAPVEVFKDPNAEELLDVKKFPPLRYPAPLAGDIEAVNTMASDPNQPVDDTRIRRVVDGMVAKLTDTRNIQALIDPPPRMAPSSPTARAIQDATHTLLEPMITARNQKSTRFLTQYTRALLTRMTPLLKHHLVPRVQAMIVLGQSGSPEAYKIFVDEIKNPQQTVWVKMWAMRGLTNIKLFAPNRLSATQEIEAARLIADLLTKNPNLPWPVQLRGMETMVTLRQGFVPTAPKEAQMAAAAMRILADPQARAEVRAEAAKALGYMQITSAVPNFNFALVAHAATRLAAQIGDQIAANYSEKGAPLNAVKAEYLASILVGPVYQAFDGQQGVRESGLLHTPAAAADRANIQKLLDATRPMARAAVELVRAPTGQLKARRADLIAQVATLKEFLAKNGPANRHLVPGDDGYPDSGGDQQAAAPDSEPAADKVVGARGGK